MPHKSGKKSYPAKPGHPGKDGHMMPGTPPKKMPMKGKGMKHG